MEINSLKVDQKKAEEGVWFEISEKTRIKLARIGALSYKKEVERLMKPYAHQRLHNKSIPLEIREDLAIQALAKTIILDWEGFTEDGNPYPYSYENAIKLLRESPPFAEYVTQLASSAEEFFREGVETAGKN